MSEFKKDDRVKVSVIGIVKDPNKDFFGDEGVTLVTDSGTDIAITSGNKVGWQIEKHVPSIKDIGAGAVIADADGVRYWVTKDAYDSWEIRNAQGDYIGDEDDADFEFTVLLEGVK